MPAPVGPYTLPAVGVGLNVPVPPGDYDQVVVDNASPYTCAVNIGGPQRWLAAFTSDLYQIEPGAAVTVTPAVALTGASADATLTATFYRPDETPDGTYPVSLTSQAIVAALTAGSTIGLNPGTNVGLSAGSTVGVNGTVPISTATALPVSGTVGVSGTVPISAVASLPVAGTVGVSAVAGNVDVLAQQQLIGTGTTPAGGGIANFNVPLWCRKIVVIARPGGTTPAVPIAVQVTGATSNFVGINWSAPAGNFSQVLLSGSIYGTVDTQVAVGITPAGAGQCNFWVIAVEEDDVYGSPGNPQNSQGTTWPYSDGIVDTVTHVALTTATAAAAFLPAPPAGFLTRVSGVSIINTGTSATVASLVTTPSSFLWQTLAPGACVYVPGPWLIGGALSCGSTVATTTLTFAAMSKTVPLLR